jgi:hypothetical protein
MSHVVLKGVAIKVEAHLSGLGDEPEAFLHLTSLYSIIGDLEKSQNKCECLIFGPICYCDDMYLCQID